MASIKIIFHANGVYIQALHDRQKAIKKILALDPKYWGANHRIKKSHPNANIMNLLISEKMDMAEKKLFQLELEGLPFSAKDILTAPMAKEIYIITVCQAIMQKATENKESIKTYRKLNNLHDHFNRFGDMPIDQFGVTEMKAFEKFLNDQPKINSLETSARYLKDLKRCLRYQDYNNKRVMEFRLTFGSNPRPKLTAEEIEKIAAFNISKYNFSRDVFLACFYCWGSRISSILTLQPHHIQGDRLIFLEYKGKNKTKSVKINSKMQTIIDRYAGQSAFYLLPGLRVAPLPEDASKEDKFKYDKKIESRTSVINKELKVIAAACGINKTISTHVARHSFAYLSHKNGVEMRLIQKMLGHTTFQMTENYIKSLAVDDELDSAADLIY